MFLLPWWTYVLIGTIAFASALVGQWLANMAELGIEQPDDGPFPCFAHLGTDDDGAEDWCCRLVGHDGEHLGMRQEPASRVHLKEGEELEYISPGVYRVIEPVLPEIPRCVVPDCERWSGHGGAHY